MVEPDPGEAPSLAEAEEARLREQLETVQRSVAELRGALRGELEDWCAFDRALDQRELWRRLRRTEGQLAQLRASPPHRLGEALLEPARRLRDLGRRLRVRLQPAPLAPPRETRPFDKYQRLGAYHWRLAEQQPWYRDRLHAVADWAEPGFCCLDLGCGDAAAAAVVAAECAQVVGVDTDAHALEAGRQELERREVDNVELIQADLGQLDPVLGARRFDLVYALDVIEHLPEPERLLDVIEARCRPGGLVILGTPLYLSEAAFSPYHVREFTIPQLETLLFPRFRTIGAQLLPSPRPDRKQHLDPRYYFYVGRARRRRLV